jgi:hypothetical protein
MPAHSPRQHLGEYVARSQAAIMEQNAMAAAYTTTGPISFLIGRYRPSFTKSINLPLPPVILPAAGPVYATP